jgi:hypothetical protein
MSKKYRMDLRSKGDYLLFAWLIILATIMGFGITKGTNTVNWIAFFYFIIGLFASVVLSMWVARNKRMWKEQESLTTCDNCGTEFRRAPHEIRKHKKHFCSSNCYIDYKRETGYGFPWAKNKS